MSARAEQMDRLAGQVRQALEDGDLDAYAALLDKSVRWGSPGDPVPPCRSRPQVLAWYQRGRSAGARARVTETVVAGDKIVVGLHVTRPAAAGATTAGESDRWQVLTVRGGRIAEITGFAGRDEAAAWAGLTAPGAAHPAAIEWAAPACRLGDEVVGLRLPEAADATILHRYATQPGGLDGLWAPLAAGASLAECQAVIGDWLAGWRNERSYHGPALVVTAAGEAALAGLVGLVARSSGVVELSYGIAPDRRGRGYARSAARLTAQWLLDERAADVVELRIAPANAASQRVAHAAGFARADACDPKAASDLRFTRGR